MSYVAAGRFDGYWEWELNYWDIAAGMVILKEAGGFVDFMEPGTINSNKRNVLVTNSSIQDELKAVLIKKNIE
jgi:myo-inositol-1(or 4)-monophosphatase